MGKSNIDPIIQNKLQNFKSQLDKEALWNSISGSIPTPAGVTTPTAHTDSTISGNIPNPAGVAVPVAQTDNTSTQVIKATSLVLLLTLSAGMAYYFMNTEQAQATHIANTQTHQIVTPTPESESTTSLSSTVQVDNGTMTETTNETSSSVIEEIQNSISNTNTPSNTGATLQVADQIVTQSTQVNVAPTQFVQSKTIQKSNNPNHTQALLTQANTRAYKAVAKASTSKSNEQLNALSVLNTGSLLPFNISEKKEEISLSNLAPIKDKVNCYDYSNKKPKISLLAYYGPGMSVRSLTANTTTPEMNNYESARNDSEVLLENHRVGLQIKATHKSGIYGKAGIEASVINEKFSQYSRSVRSEVQYGLIETITLPDGTIEEVYGDQEVTIISKKEWKNYNKFETVDLTAILGYEALISKWSYHVEAGVIYNLGSRFNGTFLDANTLQPHEVPSDYYKSKTGIDLHLAAGIGYDITNNVTLNLSPSARYDLKMVNQTSYPLDQKYVMVNLLAGVEYRF